MIIENNTDFLFLFLVFGISFIVTTLTVRWLIVNMKAKGIVGPDMNKESRPLIPEMGGISVVIGFFFGIYIQIFFFEIYDFGQVVNSYLLCAIDILNH